jgi:phage protein D
MGLATKGVREHPMSQFDAGAAVLADRTRRTPAGSLPSERASELAVDPVRDNAEAEAGAAASAGSRDLVVVNPKQTAPKGKPSRYADALFLAHVFASKFDAPQQREKRRAEPADANASYRKSAKPPAKLGRVLSKKV